VHTKSPSREKGAIYSLTSSTNHSKLPSIVVTGRLAKGRKGAFRAVCIRSTTADENLKFVWTMAFRRETTKTTIIMPQRYYQVTHNCGNYATSPTNVVTFSQIKLSHVVCTFRNSARKKYIYINHSKHIISFEIFAT